MMAERARLMGEPPWADGSEAQIRDWARHESVINVAFSGLPVSVVCPYDLAPCRRRCSSTPTARIR